MVDRWFAEMLVVAPSGWVSVIRRLGYAIAIIAGLSAGVPAVLLLSVVYARPR